MNKILALLAAALALGGLPALAADPLADITVAANAVPGFAGFSAERGARFFRTPGGSWSCSTCHSDDPRRAGRHAVTSSPARHSPHSIPAISATPRTVVSASGGTSTGTPSIDA